MNLNELLKTADGHRFQKELGEFCAVNNLKTIVETGAGVSSLFILKSFDEHGIDGKLYSIDPSPWCGYEVKHPKYELIKKKSVEVYKKEFYSLDLFLHDGNHDIFCQTYEYEFYYGILKQGGWLASDDVNWGNNGAWKNFLLKNKLKPVRLGTIEMVQKVDSPIEKDQVKKFKAECIDLALEAERKWLEAGNVLTDCFKESAR